MEERAEPAAAGSVTRLVTGMKAGEEGAFSDLWRLYFQRLVQLARVRLGSAPRVVADEEDVALSALKSLWTGAQAGRFDQLSDRDDLWKLLVVITTNKAIDQKRWENRQRRGGGAVISESALEGDSGEGPYGIARIVQNEPTPEFAVILAEEYVQRIDALGDDVLRRVATLRMEGYSNNEIASAMNVVPRTVIRKLNMIRSAWGGSPWSSPGDTPEPEGDPSCTAA